jgi:DNA-binding CsgD family transcriptional regulator
LRSGRSGRVTADAERLADAVATLGHSNARLELARTHVELGALLRRTGRRAAARGPLSAGMDLAHACGAATLAERVREELRTTGARPRRLALTGAQALRARREITDVFGHRLAAPDGRPPAPKYHQYSWAGGHPPGAAIRCPNTPLIPRRTLTAAQRRVAALAAEGLTNRQIAQRLFVTPATVETHLRHAFQKLDVGSRREPGRRTVRVTLGRGCSAMCSLG